MSVEGRRTQKEDSPLPQSERSFDAQRAVDNHAKESWQSMKNNRRRCQARKCLQRGTEWAWFEDGPITVKVVLCKGHFDEWAAPAVNEV